jgi:D-alanyl-D-alanine carboxypeptidase
MEPKFPIYSIAKSFVAQAVLELGVPLDQPVGNLISGLHSLYSERKLENLLNHTSGLSDYSQLSEYREAVSAGEDAWSRDTLLNKALQLPNNHVGFNYSNVGYLLLRMLVESETGLSMFDALRHLVFEPLAIEGFEEWETQDELVPLYDPKWVYSGTFTATESAVLNGYLKLTQHRANTLGFAVGCVEVPYSGTGFDKPGYGYGFMCDLVTEEHQPAFVGHGGAGPGYSHMILANTKTWKIGFESSSADFNQAEAIQRLRGATAL